jgi:hypothetical protein
MMLQENPKFLPDRVEAPRLDFNEKSIPYNVDDESVDWDLDSVPWLGIPLFYSRMQWLLAHYA